MLYVGEIMSHLGTNTIALKGELLLGQVRKLLSYAHDIHTTRMDVTVLLSEACFQNVSGFAHVSCMVWFVLDM